MILALQKLPEDTVVRDLVYKESLHGRKPIEDSRSSGSVTDSSDV